VLLKEAKRGSRVSARLVAAVEQERKKGSYYLFTGFLPDGLALRAVALIHAPERRAPNRAGAEACPRVPRGPSEASSVASP
jgi:hypothetical protein